MRRRQVYLRQAGLIGRDETVLVPAQVDALKSASLARAEARIAAAPDRVRAGNAEAFAGVYERPVDLPHERFAVMALAKKFKLVPWRPELERHRGKTLSVTARANGGVVQTCSVSRDWAVILGEALYSVRNADA